MNQTHEPWSRFEVEAIVADYFAMLEKELRGEAYNKTEHRRRLLPLLQERTEGSIEYKHQNISAVLIDLGYPYVDGYKPQRNYQQLLHDVIEDRLDGAHTLNELLLDAVTRTVEPPSFDDILRRLVDPPSRAEHPPSYSRDSRPAAPTTTNYLEKEARNATLGAAGEAFVLDYERARLTSRRRERLAARVEQVSVTRGDHLGFDVLSFEEDGSDRLIEVKTTAFGSMTPFFVSVNQVDTSRREQAKYHVYRLFHFRSAPEFFALQGAIDEAVDLTPSEFIARPG